MITRLLVLLVLSGLVLSSAASELEIDSDISNVTIYSNGATVTRSATVQLSEGETTINFSGLPADINIESLQIEIANRAVRMGQVSFKTKQSRDVVDQEVLRLESEIQAIKTKLSVLEDASKVAKLQLKFLESLANGYAKEAWVNTAQANANIGSWQQALNLMQSGSSGAFSDIRDNQLKALELKKDLSLLERSLENARYGEKVSKVVHVSLVTDKAVTSKIKLHYYQSQASWYPTYEARLDSDTGELSLAQKAVIQQATTESWSNVKVMLSTSQPTADLAAPKVGSVFLGLRPKNVSVEPYAGASQLEEVVVTSAKRSYQPENVSYSDAAQPDEAWSGSYALNFPIAGRVSISNSPSDAETYDLEKFIFSTQLITQVVPHVSTQAFLGARFTNDQKAPLQGNGMTVFVDGMFIGSTHMETILPGAEVTLPMGQDKRIEINVIDQGGQSGRSGVISKQQVDVTDLVYEITNRRSAETTLEVKGVYPTSNDKSLKVTIDKSSTEPNEKDVAGKVGTVVWRKTLDPSEKWTIKQSYKVAYPAGRSLFQR